MRTALQPARDCLRGRTFWPGFPWQIRWLMVLVGWALASPAQAQPALYYSFPVSMSTNWVSYSVPLVETAGWQFGSLGGPPATQAQIQSALGALKALLIEYVGSNPSVFFDNVSLNGLVTSTFNGCTADSWTTSAGLTINCVIGNPPPSIAVSGAPSRDGFEAPGKFLGNQSAAYGGNLTFDANDGLGSGTTTGCIITLVQAPGLSGPFTPFEWGYYNFGIGAIPPGVTNVAQVSAGSSHVLALGHDGTVMAWGSNASGQTNVPAGLSNVVAVAAGGVHSLALKSDGTVVAWGANSAGQTNVPVALSNVVAVAGGYQHSLALRSDGTVFGWGSGFRTLTNPIPGFTNVAALVAQNIYSLEPGGTNLVLRRDGSVTAWTAGSLETTNVLVIVTNLPANWTNLVAVAAGGRHLLALAANGTVLATGNNTSGQTNVPTGLANVVAIAGGGAFSLALRADGTVVGWGDNSYNQTNVPAGVSNVVGIAAANMQSIVLLGSNPPIQQVQLVSAGWNDGLFSLSLPSQNGRVYALEYKDTLGDTDWKPLPLVAGTGAVLALSDPTASGNQRFYRVRRW